MAMGSRGVERKVLNREDFGLCVCWPKTMWNLVPPPGETTEVLVGGEPAVVRVHSEPCNCQGSGWHEHRFLGFVGPGVAAGQRVEISVPEAHVPPSVAPADGVPITLTQAVDEVNEAAFLDETLSATRRKELAAFISARQGLPGSYRGLPAAVGDEIAEGYTVFTGDRMRKGGGAGHMIGEEALRAAILLTRQAPAREQAAAARRVAAMASEMDSILGAMPNPGYFCCMSCSVAVWRVYVLGGYSESEARLAQGLRWLSTRRDGKGSWKGFPYYYTVSALVEASTEEARAELSYARRGAERRLARLKPDDQPPYGARRQLLLERALVL